MTVQEVLKDMAKQMSDVCNTGIDLLRRKHILMLNTNNAKRCRTPRCPHGSDGGASDGRVKNVFFTLKQFMEMACKKHQATEKLRLHDTEKRKDRISMGCTPSTRKETTEEVVDTAPILCIWKGYLGLHPIQVWWLPHPSATDCELLRNGTCWADNMGPIRA